MPDATVTVTLFDIDPDHFSSENDIRRFFKNSLESSNIILSHDDPNGYGNFMINSIDFHDKGTPISYPVFSEKEPKMI